RLRARTVLRGERGVLAGAVVPCGLHEQADDRDSLGPGRGGLDQWPRRGVDDDDHALVLADGVLGERSHFDRDAPGRQEEDEGDGEPADGDSP
ncbi:MAG: hypothetical protein WCI75_19935, partial [candidate division NC10 bacterium]